MPITPPSGLAPFVLCLVASVSAGDGLPAGPPVPPRDAPGVGASRGASVPASDAHHGAWLGTPVAGPALAYGTFAGGAFLDEVRAVAVRPDGRIVLAGQTGSAQFPVTPGAPQTSLAGLTDAFVACVEPDTGALVWSTFLGGADAGLFFPEAARALAVDAAGNTFVAGQANSSDFPTTPGVLGPVSPGPSTVDGFVAKLDVDGHLVWSTYLGGEGDDYVTSLALDATGRPHVGGHTFSRDFPVTAGAFDGTFSSIFFTNDAFVARLAADGSAVEWGTYLGGSLRDEVFGLAVDAATGDVLATGLTGSADFPATSGAFDTTFNGASAQKVDAFVTRIASDGAALQWSTFLGGADVVQGRALALAANGDAWIGGLTESADLPVTSGVVQATYGGGVSDGFAARLAADGSDLVTCTYFGGTGEDAVHALALTSAGQPTLAGTSASRDLAVTSDAPDDGLGGPADAFLARLDVAAQERTHATYLGGAAAGDEGFALVLDVQGAAWLGGRTDASDFPVTSGAFDVAYAGSGDAFLARHVLGPWIDLGHGLAGFGGAAPRLLGGGTLEGGEPYSLVLSGARPNALAILFLGFSVGAVNFKCGTLVPFPFAASFTLFTFPDGTIPLFVPDWPVGIPAQSTVTFQYFIADPAAICFASGSNALQAYTP